MQKQSTLSWLILITLSIVWGSSFILMKRGLVTYTSDEVAGLRITIASVFMMPFLIKHYQFDIKKNIKGILLMGVFGNLIPAFLFTKAETQISSSLTGMLNALTPLFTILVGYIVFKTKISSIKFIGVAIGFIGALALILFSDSNEESKNKIYSLLVVAATLCYAISVNGIKAYLSAINGITATVWAFTLIGPMAAIYLFGFTDVVKHTYENPAAPQSLGYISVLAIVGSALSVIIFNKLIKLAGTVFASSCTYLIPVVAIGWGIVDNETVNMYQLVAIVVIIGSVLLVNFSGIKKNL